MTAIWGPLGWMTLHSTAFAYPEFPTQAEKNLMNTWLDLFRDTITCVHCKGHFTEMLASYRRQFPNMLGSRQDFAMFTLRAHNAVNRRLRKPVYMTLQDCMETLRNNVKTRKASDYRISYINHIMRYWNSLQDISGIVTSKKVLELKKIEIEYVSSRDTNFTIDLNNDVVVLPKDMLEPVEPGEQPRPRMMPPVNSNTRAGMQFKGGVFRLRM